MKSIFGGHVASATQSNRSMINPVGNPSSINSASIDNIINKQTFSDIEKKYTSLLADKNFAAMQPDIIEYYTLYDKISKLVLSTNTNDKMVQLLFKITLQGLMGSIHAFHLNAANVELHLKTLDLQDRIQTILSDKNTYAVVMDTGNKMTNDPTSSTSSTSSSTSKDRMSLVKTVSLAPVYSYYILLFGVPENGFDPIRIQQLAQVLQQYNVDPFI